MKKAVLLIAVLIGAAALWAMLRHQPADLQALRDGVARMAEIQRDNPLPLAALYGLIYVLVTALSLPVAAVLTLGAGALFGFWQGLLIVSFASAIGATLAFLAARYLLRDWVRSRLGGRAPRIDAGLRRDGPFYLFSLRLIPVIPFFAINLLMALTPIRARTFYWVSQLGMLPATAVYVNAGTQIGALDSLSGIVSPRLLASFALLAAFPWIARAALGALRRRRLYAGHRRPRRFDRNLIVIGAGAGGLVAAAIAAASKAEVTLVEDGRMGGDCLNTGCVPSKTLIRSARLAHQMRHAETVGLTACDPPVPFAQVIERVHDAIARIAPHDSAKRFEAMGVDVVQGHARLIDPWTVEITAPDQAARRLTSRAMVLATGARPTIPPLPGLDRIDYLTSDTLWDRLRGRDAPPRRLVVLGGGPIGCELSQAFQRLGSQVHLIEMAPRLLMREDAEVSDLIRDALAADGVEVLTDHRAIGCGTEDGQTWIEVETGGQSRRIAFDEIIVAVGRTPRLDGLGLEDLGIPTDGVVETDDYLQTLYPNILAAGDVAGPYQLTHAAGHQGWIAAMNALFGSAKRFRADRSPMPWAVFTDPEIARVGLSRADARKAGIAHEVTRYDLADLDRAITDGAARGFVQVLTPPGKDRILGVTIVGDHAGDLMAEFALAMTHGLGLGKILGTVHIYPTWAEANKNAAGLWRRAHLNPRLISVVKRYHRWRRR